MSGPRFTPGPWTVSVPQMGFSQITGPNGELIFGLAAGGAEEKQPDDVCDANARLIEAATELYAALNHVEAVLSIVLPRSHMAEYVATLAEVRAALAKAEGRS